MTDLTVLTGVTYFYRYIWSPFVLSNFSNLFMVSSGKEWLNNKQLLDADCLVSSSFSTVSMKNLRVALNTNAKLSTEMSADPLKDEEQAVML